MVARFRSWWQKVKQHRVAFGVVGIAFVVVIALLIAVVLSNGTGFNGYNQVTTAHTISGTNAGTIIRTEEYQPGKTLWDWLQLLGVLAIPVVVGFGAVWFTTRQGKVADAENKDNQRETALQAYIDKISELILKEHLGELTEDGKLKPEYAQVRKIARLRTITVLTQLDARRIGYVFAFLREAGLMSTTSNDNAVSLSRADLHAVNWSQARLSEANLYGANLNEANLSSANFLSANLSSTSLGSADLSHAYLWEADLNHAYFLEADLSHANLVRANLSYATLSHANLIYANLIYANLSHADLNGANLSEAKLTGASVTAKQLEQTKSLKGATMPDGSKHP